MGSASPEDAAADALVSVGEVVSGKFRVERLVGSGGMGVVVEAIHLQLDERVALKFLHRSAMANPDIVSRFKQEARAAVRLKSAYVARVMDVGTREDGVPYIVMEYLKGRDLAHVLLDRGVLPIAEAVEFVIQACEAVSEAHARGIIHRDLKPENLFMVEHEDGWQAVKVLDFGISKAALTGGAADPILVTHRTMSILGSPFYMSPEQVRATSEVDARSDVWSLGATLFELLAGTTAFDETKSFTELVADILGSPHRRLLDFRSDCPRALQEVVDRCLAKDRGARYQSVAEFALALLPFAPKRARVPAERALALARSAGKLSDPNIALPPSRFPPADPHSSGNMAIAPLGVVDTPQSRARTEPAPPEDLPQPSVREPRADDKKRTWILAGVALFLVLATFGAIKALRGKGASSDPAAAPSLATTASSVPAPASATSPSAAASSANGVTAPEKATSPPKAAPTTTAVTTSTASSPASPATASPAVVPHGGRRTPPKASGTPPASTLDIRLER